MRTRRIIWVLAVLLSLGSLQAAPVTRVAAYSEICVVSAAVKTAPLRLRFVRQAALQFLVRDEVAFACSLEESRPRFQLPPPFFV